MSIGKPPGVNNFFSLKKCELPPLQEVFIFKQFLETYVQSYQVKCNGSQGEQLCTKRIRELYPDAQIWHEVTLKSLPLMRYDLVFYLSNLQKVFFLEFDGSQHFEKKHAFYKKDKNAYNKCRISDCQKTQHILELGFPIIRIEWDKDHLIREHLKVAVTKCNEKRRYYRSTPNKYKYISKYLNALS